MRRVWKPVIKWHLGPFYRRRPKEQRPWGSIAGTDQRWLNAYLEHGLDGLCPRKAPGKPGKIPAALADEVKRWVIQGPAA